MSGCDILVSSMSVCFAFFCCLQVHMCVCVASSTVVPWPTVCTPFCSLQIIRQHKLTKSCNVVTYTCMYHNMHMCCTCASIYHMESLPAPVNVTTPYTIPSNQGAVFVFHCFISLQCRCLRSLQPLVSIERGR